MRPWLILLVVAGVLGSTQNAVSADRKTVKGLEDIPGISVYDPNKQVAVPPVNVNRIFAADISDDESLLASGYEDGTINIWDLKSRKILRTLNVTSALIEIIRFLPDNRTIAVVNSRYSGTVYTFDIVTGKELWRIKASDKIMSLDVARNGDLIAIGCYDGNINLWKITERTHVLDIRQRVPVDTISLSPNEKYILAGGEDSTIRLWTLVDGRLNWQKRAHSSMIGSVHFSASGDMFLSTTGNINGNIKIWKTDDKSEIISFEGAGGDAVFSKRGELIFSSGKIFRVKDGHVARLGGYDDATTSDVMLEFGGGRMIAAPQDGEIRFWDLATLGAPLPAASNEAGPPRLRFERDPIGPTISK